MTWRVAHCLEVLKAQVDAAFPDRSKVSDGFIGDAAHAASASDHNPNADGVVCAFDITHDPFHGCDGAVLAEAFRVAPHPDVKYVIWDHRMFSRYPHAPYGPFEWRPYMGADPHTNHVHVSVGVGPDGHSVEPYDDSDSWTIGPSSTPAPPQPQPPTMEDSMQFHYGQLEGAPTVYLCNVATKPRGFVRFDDAEYWAKLGGHTVTEFGMVDDLGPDDINETRKGHIVKADDNRALVLWGFKEP